MVVRTINRRSNVCFMNKNSPANVNTHYVLVRLSIGCQLFVCTWV